MSASPNATAELANLLSALQGATKRRKKAIKESGLFSYSLDKLETTFQLDRAIGKNVGVFSRVTTKIKGDTMGYVALGAAYRGPGGNQRMAENAMRYVTFLNEKTSTPAGIREVNKNQDVSVFGVGEGGSAKYTFGSEEERKLFWSIVDTFRANPTGRLYDFYSLRDSGLVELWMDTRTRPMTVEEGIQLMNEKAPSVFYDAEEQVIRDTSEYTGFKYNKRFEREEAADNVGVRDVHQLSSKELNRRLVESLRSNERRIPSSGRRRRG